MPSALLLASSRTMATLRVRKLRNHAVWECIFRIRDRNSADGIRTTSRPTGKTKPYSGPTTQIREGKSRLADLLQGIVTGRSGRLTGVQVSRIDSITELASHADDRKGGPRSNRRSPEPKKVCRRPRLSHSAGISDGANGMVPGSDICRFVSTLTWDTAQPLVGDGLSYTGLE
jgi:hypothetical protein